MERPEMGMESEPSTFPVLLLSGITVYDKIGREMELYTHS